ncbi:alginate lyase family protein [Pontiellaceae bacterium B1224]|nr:alginate lyase family protein [Pontiellaceae bacterium B1224]
MKSMISIVIFLLGMVCHGAQSKLNEPVGAPDFSDWSGISNVRNNEAELTSGKPIRYTYSGQNRVYPNLKREFKGDAADWYDYAGLSFEVFLAKPSTAEIVTTFKADPLDHMELNPASTAKALVSGEGWQTVYLSWDLFDVNIGQQGNALQGVKELEITVESAENKNLQIRNIRVTKGEQLALETSIQGRAVNAGGTVSYEFKVGNTTDQPQGVQLLVEKLGWESMIVSMEPSMLQLAPGETKSVQVEVAVPASLPDGAREKQVIKAIPNGKGSAAVTIEYFTSVALPTPNIVFTADKWQEVKDKVANYEWAAQELADYEKKASKWNVPKASFNSKNPRQALFHKGNADELNRCGIVYQLTGDEAYAEKVITLLRELSDVETGYPATEQASGEGFVHEGVFFQGVARSYDMVRNSELLTEEDHALIQNTMRLFVNLTIKYNTRGGISNWNVAEVIGALYCALALQDWNLIDTLLYSPTGVYAQMYHGIMADGWWYECAVGYNTWVASEFSETAIALEPWGINLKDQKFLIGTTPHFSLQASRRVAGLHGMSFEKWGSINQNYIGIKEMWDAAIPFLDYRGVIFAVNDAKESFVTGKPYELAYYLYRDPEFAAVINRGDKRDLLYGVPELPDVTSEMMTQSAYADNFGAVMLRSQTPDREQREQIQAVLHYGSHGGHHGHFDRLNFINMMRYGRSFYNPEMFWYGYASYLYKFLVQTSLTKNMVVVDQKQQEPRESFRTFYYTGDMMQATAVESISKWSHPPYGGLVYTHLDGIDFKAKSEEENRSLYIPDETPEYGLCTDYTEDILQRRLMIMMDDYVVLADYLDADEEHTFDWLMQIKGFQGLEADKVELVRHDGQMNKDPLGTGQFITDCDWYETEGTSRATFKTLWGEGADNAGARMPNSEDGVLMMDVFNAWPQQNEIMIGTAPESFGVNKRVWFSLMADGETLVDESTGAWILGAQDIEVNISGKKELVLTTRTEKPKNNTIFWGDAKLILDDGSEVFVSSLPVQYDNILQPTVAGEDYYGGPVKIEGIRMDNSTPGMPQDFRSAGSITLDLTGMNAVAFKATIGGDFPMGDETQRRKTMAVRSTGSETRYLSIIEPYETESVVKSVTAKSANELTVELVDGSIQEIIISGFAEEDQDVSIDVKEFKDGELIREEKTF